MTVSKEGPLYNGAAPKIESKERENIFINTIVALDVDGVLVEPLAYRKATKETISFFAQKIGVDPQEFTLDDNNKAFGRNMGNFEANGIHDPWDASAIIVSLMLLKKEGISVSTEEALKEYVKDDPEKNGHPPDIILSQLESKYAKSVSPKTMEEIKKMLTDTRKPEKNIVTSVFQEFVLGNEIFEQVYGKKGIAEAQKSLIKTEDKLLIDSLGKNAINEISIGGGKIIFYTGRPGFPPSDYRKTQKGYSPEAELAIELSGINDKFPPLVDKTVSMGSMQWLAKEMRVQVENITKPNSTQALAVILATVRGGDVDSKLLRDAFEWDKNGKIPPEIGKLIKKNTQEKLSLVVVEDSRSGVIAFINAKKILDNVGLNVSLTAIGIDGGDETKTITFEGLRNENEKIEVINSHNINEGITQFILKMREAKREEQAKGGEETN